MFEFYNPVGDPAYDEITHKNYVVKRYVGPIQPNDKLVCFNIIGYVPACSKVTLSTIKLEYADGTSETIEYGYSTESDYFESIYH